ncbi:hypothetical protein KW791_04150 [Candidatus Parcubacteria bacterium]|nr:hypothetical protein [Candidatus Parcubacteria bacterium]
MPGGHAEGISWTTPLFPPKKKEAYLTSLALVGCVAVLAYFHQSLLFMIMLGLSAFVLILHSHKDPEIQEINVDKVGVSVDDQKFYFKDIKSFWIDYNPPHTKELSIELKKAYMPYIRLPIHHVNPLEIRSIMVSYIPEKEHVRSILEDIGTWLGI